MSRKSKVSWERKLCVVEAYLTNQRSVSEIAQSLNVGKTAVKSWIKTYKEIGTLGLRPTDKNASYSRELKLSAVQDYLLGAGSYDDISIKYNLRSSSLKNWVKKYNSHEEIKPSYSGGTFMAKGRKTTLEERIEIIKYCIEHDKDYKITSMRFEVSYQQVRNWTLKYEANGIEGLQDRRGKKKPIEEMSEIEKLRAENKLL